MPFAAKNRSTARWIPTPTRRTVSVPVLSPLGGFFARKSPYCWKLMESMLPCGRMISCFRPVRGAATHAARASARIASTTERMAVPPSARIEILDEDDLVPRFVVQKLVDLRVHEHQPEAAGAQAFLLPDLHVLDRVAFVGDRGVREVL